MKQLMERVRAPIAAHSFSILLLLGRLDTFRGERLSNYGLARLSDHGYYWRMMLDLGLISCLLAAMRAHA